MSEVDKSAEDVAGDWAAVGAGLDVRIAQELIERARAEGVSLVGQGGLLQQVTRTVLQRARRGAPGCAAGPARHIRAEDRAEARPAGRGFDKAIVSRIPRA